MTSIALHRYAFRDLAYEAEHMQLRSCQLCMLHDHLGCVCPQGSGSERRMSSAAPSERSPAPGNEAEGGVGAGNAEQDVPMDGRDAGGPSEAEDAAGAGGEQGGDSGADSGSEHAGGEDGDDGEGREGSGRDDGRVRQKKTCSHFAPTRPVVDPCLAQRPPCSHAFAAV